MRSLFTFIAFTAFLFAQSNLAYSDQNNNKNNSIIAQKEHFEDPVPISVFKKSVCISFNLPKNDSCVLSGHFIYSLSKKQLLALIQNPVPTLRSIKPQFKAKVQKQIKHIPTASFSLVPIVGEEFCIISGLLLDPKLDAVIQHKGRRFPFKQEAIATFISDPQKQFRKKEMISSLFTEDAKSNKKMNLSLFYITLYFLISFILGGICSSLALTKGLSTKKWFVLGFIFNFISLIIIIILKKVELPSNNFGFFGRVQKTREPIACHKCGYLNHPSALLCSKCQGNILANNV